MSLTIGIDLGGTKTAGGVVDEQGNILAKLVKPTPVRDAESTVKVIADIVAELMQEHAAETIGIGAAGFIDQTRSRVMFAPNLGWIDEPLRALVEQLTSLPTIVENDANAAAWGEYRFGAGAGIANLVVVTVGTGIGGGIIVDGRMLRGAFGAGAEIGHLQMVPNGLLCGCGLSGCWEQYASGQALVREARLIAGQRRPEASLLLSLGDGTPEGVSGKAVTEAARQGDPVALAAFNRVGAWLGRGMADLAAILDPGRFVVGGGVSEAGDLLLVPARAAFLENLSAREHRPIADVVQATVQNDAGLLGAADLARTI